MTPRVGQVWAGFAMIIIHRLDQASKCIGLVLVVRLLRQASIDIKHLSCPALRRLSPIIVAGNIPYLCLIGISEMDLSSSMQVSPCSV